MAGIICINKPKGYTSFDVVAKLRGILKMRRIGHAGTLDPMAEGVLPVFIGSATKACDMLPDHDKIYRAGFKLGLVTDTQDSTGTVLEERPVSVTRAELEAVLPRFTGTIRQVPPMYSALKVNGPKLCDLARQGREVERKPREITIFELELLEQTGPAEWRLRCVCSKGTYIRTLCHDIGQALGCGGCMSGLRRTMAAGFTIDRTVTVETVQERGEAVLLPLDAYFAPYPAYTIPSPGRENRVRNGNPITDARLKDGTYRVYGGDGTFLCLSEAKGGTLTAVKNFFGT